MYVMIQGSDGGVVYLELPEKPMIRVSQTDDGDYAAYLTLPEGLSAVVLDVGDRHQVHETVNKILQKLNLKPERL